MTTRRIKHTHPAAVMLAACAALLVLPSLGSAAEQPGTEAKQVKLAQVAGAEQALSAVEIAAEESVDSALENCRPVRRLGGKVQIRRHDCTK